MNGSRIDVHCRAAVCPGPFLNNRPALVHSNSTNGVDISAANTNSSNNSPYSGMVARSCPKPILMPRRSRQGSLANHDELSVFVPPHELAASSLLDPTNVSLLRVLCQYTGNRAASGSRSGPDLAGSLLQAYMQLFPCALLVHRPLSSRRN
jgi:hypothetical protein